MLHLIQSIPMTKHIVDNTHVFSSEWLVTITGAKNLLDMIHWCRENYKDTKIQYYRHGSDKWSNVIPPPAVNGGYVNNINDSLRIRFKDEEDVIAFKLTWVE